MLNNFDYAYLEVNSDYVYKNCALVGEIDEYMLKYNFKRIETKWTKEKWGDALYIKINNNIEVLKNIRCSEEIWNINNITFEEALQKAKLNPKVKALHWNNKNGVDGRIKGTIYKTRAITSYPVVGSYEYADNYFTQCNIFP